MSHEQSSNWLRRTLGAMVVVLGLLAGACDGNPVRLTPDGSIGPGCTGPGCGSTVGSCSSDGDCATGLVCDLTVYQCVQCRSQRDCLDTEFCKAGACAPDVCVQNTSSCVGNTIVTCLSDGSGIGSTVPCGTRQTCTMQGTTPACANWTCTPAAKSCQVGAEMVVTCDADGLHQTPAEDCGAKNQVCVSGACLPVVCTANTRFCSGRELHLCSAKGDSSTLSSTCSTSQYCDSATTSCKTQVCSPSQPACNGHLATTCTETGAGYVAGGLDCSTSGQVCVTGTCQALACVPSAKYCSAGTVRQCSSDGSTSSLYQTCSSTQFCDTTTNACKTQLCTPNQPACSTTTATLCNADGSGYQEGGVDCSISSQVCVSGTCKALACVPSAKYCSAGTVRQCSSDGSTSSLYQTCSSTQFCDTTTNACKTQLCTPNQPACSATTATLCNADGSGYQTGGVDCSTSSQVCVSGTCKALACVPSAKYCSAGTVRQCSSDGSTSSLYQTCSSTQYCDTATNACKTQLCTPNQPACNANSTTLCNADGSGYAGTAQSCGTLYCVAGNCQAAMFREDFEDGDFAGWQVGSGSYTRSVTTSTAAAGTTHSLVQTGGATSVQNGLTYTFANVKPTHIGWWVMQPTTTQDGAYFVLSSGSSSNYMAWIYLKDTGYIRIYDSDTQLAEVSYLANTWYHIELRNINWTTKVFDFYVNDVRVSAAFPFRSSSAVDITQLDLFNYDPGTAYWDEIVFD